jgi:hypothetical protein
MQDTSRTLGPLPMYLLTWPNANVSRHLAYCQCPSTPGLSPMFLDTWPIVNASRHLVYCQCSSTLGHLSMFLDTWPIANASRHLAYCQCSSTLGLLPMSLNTWFSLYIIGLGYWLRPRYLTNWLDQLALTIQPILPMSELRWLANRRNLILRTYSAPGDQQNPKPSINSANLLIFLDFHCHNTDGIFWQFE